MIGYDEGTVDGAPYPSRPLLCSTKSHPYPFAYTSSDPSYEQQHAVIPCVTLDCLVSIPLPLFLRLFEVLHAIATHAVPQHQRAVSRRCQNILARIVEANATPSKHSSFPTPRRYAAHYSASPRGIGACRSLYRCTGYFCV